MRFTRRQFWQGSLALGLTGGMRLLPWLPTEQQARAAGNPNFLLTIHCDGGWDPYLVFDNQVSNPGFDKQPGLTVNTVGALSYVHHSSRPAVAAFFAEEASRSCIVNGLYCQGAGHNETLLPSLGVEDPKAGVWVDWQSYYAKQSAGSKSLPHVVINAPYLPGNLGAYTTLLTTEMITQLGDDTLPAPDEFSSGEELALASFLDWSYGEAMKRYGNAALSFEKLASLAGGLEKLPKLIKFLRETGYDPAENQLLRDGKLAVELFAQGLSQSVSLQAGPALAWDSHRDHFARQTALYENLFTNLKAITTAITAKGLQKRVTILVKSNLGRAPRLNAQGGKEHWPFSSALLWGAGIKGGQSVGVSDSFGRGKPMNPLFGNMTGDDLVPLTLKHIAAAIYQINGVSYQDFLPDTTPASSILGRG